MSTRNFTLRELRMLADIERQMDAGTQPFVLVEGIPGRAALTPELMATFELTTGQTISMPLFLAIQRYTLRLLEDRLAYEDGKALAAEVLGEEVR